jgi:pyruvate kinase
MHTKIVCTIGPSSASKNKLKAMINSGLSVARINLSHGSHESDEALIHNVRLAAKECQKFIGVMIDLQGPRLRILSLEKPVIVRDGEMVVLYEGASNKKEKDFSLGIDGKGLLKYLEKGDFILIDNGMVELEVWSVVGGKILCKVKTGGEIGLRKGLNIPRLSSRMSAFTPKDEKDLEFALSVGVDFIAMSFVKTEKNIIDLKKKIKKLASQKSFYELPFIVAKIETQMSVNNFDKILKEADGIMVARGDLAIELPMEQVPALQKMMIKKCLHNARPVIVATQMLESMMVNPRPTRAEITDVANAVIDHSDALMLSGESAMGKYPVKSVRTMSKIIEYTETSPYDDMDYKEMMFKELAPFSFVARAAVKLALEMGTKKIIIRNSPLAMAYQVSRFRPGIKILCLVKSVYEARKLSLVWGVEAVMSLGEISGSYVLVEGISSWEGKIEYRIKHKTN